MKARTEHFTAKVFWWLLPVFLLFPLCNPAQGLTSLFCDFAGIQPVTIDTNSVNGQQQLFAGNAKSQLGFGLKLMEMNQKRSIHFGMILCYREINLSNYYMHDESNKPIYKKRALFEGLIGGTYLRPRPFFQTQKLAMHMTLSAYGGLQNFAVGSNLSGGFVFLSKEGVSGGTIEFVYRPVEYTFPLSTAMDPDPYYVNVGRSWAIRAAITFGKNLKYNTSGD